MITREYINAKGEPQEISLSASEWEALTLDELGDMLGFKSEPTADPAPKPAPRRKKSGGK